MRINRYALAAIRERTAISKKEMADALGCSLGHYCDIESGRRQPNPKLIAAMADILKVRYVALLENPNDETPMPLEVA